MNEPVANAGNFCAYTGSGLPKQAAAKEVKFIGFILPFGEKIANKGKMPVAGSQSTGVNVEFQTVGFVAAGGGKVAGEAFLDVHGSWALKK